MIGALVVVALALLGLQLIDGADPRERTERGRLVHPRGNSSLAEAREFRGFPLYFAGPEVAGHRLEAVLRTNRSSPAPHVEFSFLYGGCRSVGGAGCTAPLQILLWPACYRYETRYSIPARERTSVRGVPGRLFDDPSRLELYPAGSTIVVNAFGPTSRAELLGLGRRLRGVNVPLAPAAALPARPSHAGHTIRCGSG